MSLEDLQQGFGAALREAGYNSEEKIVELVREVKREIADERESKQQRIQKTANDRDVSFAVF